MAWEQVAPNASYRVHVVAGSVNARGQPMPLHARATVSIQEYPSTCKVYESDANVNILQELLKVRRTAGKSDEQQVSSGPAWSCSGMAATPVWEYLFR